MGIRIDEPNANNNNVGGGSKPSRLDDATVIGLVTILPIFKMPELLGIEPRLFI